jgi:hypothetical protein
MHPYPPQGREAVDTPDRDRPGTSTMSEHRPERRSGRALLAALLLLAAIVVLIVVL